MRRRAIRICVAVIVGVAVAQSAAHLVLAMAASEPRTLLDVEHSNGIPDLVSTAVLALAALGALGIAWYRSDAQSLAPLLAAMFLAALTFADLLHDGAHPSSTNGRLVIGLVSATAVFVALTARGGSRRCRVTLVVAASLLAASFAVSGVDRFDSFDGRRGEAKKELRLVAKEGLELLGWSLVALALWDEALRCRGAVAAPTAPASRARAASRRRAA